MLYFKEFIRALPCRNIARIRRKTFPTKMSVLSIEKRIQPSTSSLFYEERVNENNAISIRNTLTLYFEYFLIIWTLSPIQIKCLLSVLVSFFGIFDCTLNALLLFTSHIVTRNNKVGMWAVKLRFLLIHENMLKNIATAPARSECTGKH